MLVQNHWLNIILVFFGAFIASFINVGDGILGSIALASIPALILLVAHLILYTKDWWLNENFKKVFFTGKYEKSYKALKSVTLSSLFFIIAYIIAVFLLSAGILFALDHFRIYQKINILLTARGNSQSVERVIKAISNMIVNTIALAILFKVFNGAFNFLVDKGWIKFKKENSEQPSDTSEKNILPKK